jgi:hypothetical protein
MEKTMKADITDDDCKKLNSTIQDPNIVLTVIPQQISNPKYNQTKSIALEVRVLAAHESTYLEILDRLNERACTLMEDEIDIILDDSIGTFFPYYAKKSKPQLRRSSPCYVSSLERRIGSAEFVSHNKGQIL